MKEEQSNPNEWPLRLNGMLNSVSGWAKHLGITEEELFRLLRRDPEKLDRMLPFNPDI